MDKEIVSTIGYGTTFVLTGEVSDFLLEVRLPMVNQEVCQDIFIDFGAPFLYGKHWYPLSLQPLTINSDGQDDVCRRREWAQCLLRRLW